MYLFIKTFVYSPTLLQLYIYTGYIYFIFNITNTILQFVILHYDSKSGIFTAVNFISSRIEYLK